MLWPPPSHKGGCSL